MRFSWLAFWLPFSSFPNSDWEHRPRNSVSRLQPMTERETEFREVGSQTEFGNQKNQKMWFSWTATCLFLFLAGCDWPGKPKDTDRPIPADQIEDFSTLYSTHCAGCHGTDGQGGPAPPHNDPLFLAIVPDEVLHQVITEGRTGTPMTAFAKDRGGPLTKKQID